jgi:hypothetical protein
MLRYTTRSVRRASGLVLVGYTEVIQDGSVRISTRKSFKSASRQEIKP